MSKTQIIKRIAENQYFPSTSVTQSSSNAKETCSIRLEMTHNCTTDLTETLDNSQALANSSNSNKIIDKKTNSHKELFADSEIQEFTQKKTLIVTGSILKHPEC